MRLFHLVGLAGLASLIGTSPTPITPLTPLASSTPIGPVPENPEEASKHYLVLHINNQYREPSYSIKASNDVCVKLDPPVYKELHSLQMMGKYCAFFKADACTGDPILELTAGVQENRVDMDHYNKYGIDTTAVKCVDTVTEGPGDVHAPEKRDAMAESHLILHTNAEFKDPAYKIEAVNDTCVKLSPPIYRNLHSLQMSHKSCQFFKADTCTGQPLMWLNAGAQEKRLNLDQFSKYAHETAAVKCVDKGSEEATSVAVAAPEKRDELASKRLVVYSQDKFKGVSQEIKATNRCVKLNSLIYKNVHSYGVVDQVCYFMDTDSCNGKVVITANARKSEAWGHVDVGDTNGDSHRITSVYCGDRAPVSSRTIHAPAYNPGVVRACTYAQKRETCQQVNAFESCQNFDSSVAEKIDTLKQGGYSECKYWRNKGCSNLIVTSLSGPNDYSPNLGPGNKDGHHMQSVSCKRQSNANANADIGSTIHAEDTNILTASSSRTARRDHVLEPPIYVCHDPDFHGKCFWLSGAGCAQNPFNVDAIESMKLTKGWRCAFYETVDCQPTKGPPRYWDSKDGEKEIRDVEFAIWSLTCAPFS